MIPYNVEIFDMDFGMISHTNASGIQYSEDYISPVTNKVTIFNSPVSKGNYIRIQGGERDCFGVVRSVVSRSEKTITVEYGSFLSILDTPVVFDTDLQGTSTLERVIADLITGTFISSSDSVQNITGLSVETISETADWGFNLKSDTEGKHTCIINLYNTILVRALQEYGVAVRVTPDIQAKTIVLTIGVPDDAEKVIEADLPNIIDKNIVIKETDNDVNKLVVYNTENYTTKRTYYRHTDDTYDTIDDDRITPVVQSIEGVAPEYNGDVVSRTFVQVANSKAAEVFGAIKFNNLIELAVMNDDSLVKPSELEIGQKVIVMSKGKEYESILTGYTMGQTTLLVFGTIRLDLTKIVKRRAKGGY